MRSSAGRTTLALLHAAAVRGACKHAQAHGRAARACAAPQLAAAGSGGQPHAARLSCRAHPRAPCMSAPAHRFPADGAPLFPDRPQRRATSEPPQFEAGMSDPASCAPLLSVLSMCTPTEVFHCICGCVSVAPTAPLLVELHPLLTATQPSCSIACLLRAFSCCGLSVSSQFDLT